MDVIGTPTWKSAVDNVWNKLSRLRLEQAVDDYMDVIGRLRLEQAVESNVWNGCRVGDF